jgi:hypothetical protein
MNPCSPSWLHIKLTLLCSVSVGEGLAVSRLTGKCGQSSIECLLRLMQSCASIYVEQTHGTVHADFVVSPGNVKSP